LLLKLRGVNFLPQSELDFELRLWVNELWTIDGIFSDLRYAIDQEFRDADVCIPFQQRDLHIKTCETDFSLEPSVSS
jgi:small-conductance mechanosensitive channel